MFQLRIKTCHLLNDCETLLKYNNLGTFNQEPNPLKKEFPSLMTKIETTSKLWRLDEHMTIDTIQNKSVHLLKMRNSSKVFTDFQFLSNRSKLKLRSKDQPLSGVYRNKVTLSKLIMSKTQGHSFQQSAGVLNIENSFNLCLIIRKFW
jgi:hypothetical protein